MKKSSTRDILNEAIGPTVKYGKYSSYYKKGENKIVINTKKDAEEYPEDIRLLHGTRRVIFEDSKGNIMISYDLYQNIWSPPTKKFGDSDWG